MMPHKLNWLLTKEGKKLENNKSLSLGFSCKVCLWVFHAKKQRKKKMQSLTWGFSRKEAKKEKDAKFVFGTLQLSRVCVK